MHNHVYWWLASGKPYKMALEKSRHSDTCICHVAAGRDKI